VAPSGLVYAFEPSRRELQRLQDHLKLNGRANVRVERLAFGESCGAQKRFVCQGIETGCNSLYAPLVFEQVKTGAVMVSTLDRFVQDLKIHRIDFMKLDVEGAEMMSVLKGGVEPLKRFAPVIICELVDRRTKIWNFSSRDVFEFLKSCGYQFFSFQKG
jgi:FkbM family methyltransferase